ncbi:MAG: hypothetical protein U1F68_08285 [Gammaproteobacteria bacterium]
MKKPIDEGSTPRLGAASGASTDTANTAMLAVAITASMAGVGHQCPALRARPPGGSRAPAATVAA